MRKIKISLLLSVFLAMSIFSHAEMLSLNKLLHQLTMPRITSLARLDIVNSHKGQDIQGDGKVKDVIKGFGPENKAIVYLTKHYKGNEFDLMLTVNRDNAKNIEKGKTVRFTGTFSGISYKTLRIENAKIAKNTWWPF